MVFTLTHEHLSSLLDPVREGNLESFLDAISPRVEWSIGASNKAGKRYRGPHKHCSHQPCAEVEASFAVAGWLCSGCEPAPSIVGNKAIVEAQIVSGRGLVHRNRIVLEFSPETGRISKVGAYNDTEVVAAAKRSAAAAAEDD